MIKHGAKLFYKSGEGDSSGNIDDDLLLILRSLRRLLLFLKILTKIIVF